MYFTKEFSKYFEELAGDTTRDFFHANKKRYEEHVKGPFQQLLKDVIAEVIIGHPEIEQEVKNCMFRINRDIRFSKDKTPYKLHVSGVIAKGGRKNMAYPGLYIQAGWDGLHFATGCYRPDKEQLASLRHAIIQHPKKVKKILSATDLVEQFGALQGDKNKILPKEFKPYQEKHPLIYHKQYFLYKKHPKKYLYKKNLLDVIMQHREAAAPWNHFIIKAWNS